MASEYEAMSHERYGLCWCGPANHPDAPDEWDASIPPGGYVCSHCKTPVESEPCPEHQPLAYGRMT